MKHAIFLKTVLLVALGCLGLGCVPTGEWGQTDSTADRQEYADCPRYLSMPGYHIVGLDSFLIIDEADKPIPFDGPVRVENSLTILSTEFPADIGPENSTPTIDGDTRVTWKEEDGESFELILRFQTYANSWGDVETSPFRVGIPLIGTLHVIEGEPRLNRIRLEKDGPVTFSLSYLTKESVFRKMTMTFDGEFIRLALTNTPTDFGSCTLEDDTAPPMSFEWSPPFQTP